MEHNKTFLIAKHGLLICIAGLFLYRLHTKIGLISPFSIGDALFFLVFVVISLYYNVKYHQALFSTIKNRREKKAMAEEEKKMINSFLEDKLNYATSEELKSVISNITNRYFLQKIRKQYNHQLEEKLAKAKKALEQLRYKENICDLQKEKYNMEEELKNLKELRRLQTRSEEEMLEQIKNDMNLDEQPVFSKEDLSEQQLDILNDEGYKQTNEYSILDKKNETVFVKPVMNHSTTHTFLVWEIKELLDILDMQDIKEHHTVDADITFKHKNKFYAIEVETGSLLKKRAQATDKVEYLKRKYADRWLFVVSNKNLLKEYKKLGFATQRSQVEKTIKKWLKIAPPKSGCQNTFLDE
jgi:hypothetical protein